jgi:hypothetical protein
MKKLMTAMMALSFLGATAMYAQVPAEKKDTTTTAKKAKAPKKTTEKTTSTAAKTKAPKKAKKDTTTPPK